jgi:hypothetical protein
LLLTIFRPRKRQTFRRHDSYGNEKVVGDDETPAQGGDVPYK